jgi:hypothetical protein
MLDSICYAELLQVLGEPPGLLGPHPEVLHEGPYPLLVLLADLGRALSMSQAFFSQ